MVGGEGDGQLWGVDVGPLLGAIVMCYGWGEGRVTANIDNTKIGFAIWGLCWCNFLASREYRTLAIQ